MNQVEGPKQPRQDWATHIIAIATHGDRNAFAALFDHFAPRVKSFLMRRGASEAQAEDCTQDVMVTIWKKANLFNPQRAAASTWIFTIARNRHIDLVRKQNRPIPTDYQPQDAFEADGADIYSKQQDVVLLNKAMEDLPEKQRDIIQQAFLGELSHQEIANHSGLPLGTIKSRIRLAIERMRHTMKAE